MTVEFAYSTEFWPLLRGRSDMEKYQALAQLIEASGFTAMGLGDTQYLRAECYIAVTLAASATRRILVGPCPSNPITREPSVTAAFIAGIDAMSEGRAMLVIATGDSSAYAAGRRPATMARLEEYVQAVRGLINTGEAKFDGRISRVKWTSYSPRHHIPIYIIAEGPKMLRLAGRIGDGVMLGNGFLPEVVEHSLEMIKAGADEAGRSMSDIDLWWRAQPGLAPTAKEARESIKVSMSGVGYHSFLHSLDQKHVPSHLRSSVEEYVKGYDFGAYGEGQGHNVQRMDQLGLTDYFLERFAIAGTPEDWVKRIKALEAGGVRKLWLGPFRGGMDRELEAVNTLAREVLPTFLG